MKITLDNVRQEYLQSILNAFGPTLKDLTLRSCNQISLSNLVSTCSSLESLSFLQGCSLVDEASTLNPDTFLPNLKKFESDICLGAMSHFFEGKSTLTRLVLNCSHIGNEVIHALLVIILEFILNDFLNIFNRVLIPWSGARSLRCGL